jgi:hypothetical protein
LTILTVIREPADLMRVRTSTVFPGRSLQLRIPSLEPNEARAWETRLNRHYVACGCGMSAAFLFVALCVCVLVLAGRPGGLLAVSVADLGLAALAVLAAGVVGKLVGMAVARVRLHLAIRSLWRRLQR